jgi:hypothetical protein
LLVLTASGASAQLVGPIGQGTNRDGTVVYWRNLAAAPNPSTHFKFYINTTINTNIGLFPNVTNNPSAFNNYPNNGRQFFVEEPQDPAVFGLIPIINKPKINLVFRSERNSETAITLTRFDGPEYIDQALPRWSSDNQDSFFSFQAINPTTNPLTNLRRIYRYNGSKSLLFSPLFTGFTSNDPRLTLVMNMSPNSFANDWSPNGVRLVFSTPAPFGFVTSMRDTMGNTTTLINDPAVTGFSLRNPVFSPVNNDLVFGIGETAGGLRGIAFYNVTTPNMNFGFILLEGPLNGTTINNFSAPQVSPDGRSLAFTLLQTTPIGPIAGPVIKLVRLPVTGGGIQILSTGSASAVNNSEVTGWVPGP